MTAVTAQRDRAAHGYDNGPDDAPHWSLRALCGRDPDLWSNDHHGTLARARLGQAIHLCRSHCPVYTPCAQAVDNNPHLYPGMVAAGTLYNHNHPDRTGPIAGHQPADPGHGQWCRTWPRG